jgi:hypothetical protein
VLAVGELADVTRRGRDDDLADVARSAQRIQRPLE